MKPAEAESNEVKRVEYWVIRDHGETGLGKEPLFITDDIETGGKELDLLRDAFKRHSHEGLSMDSNGKFYITPTLKLVKVTIEDI